MAGLSLVWTHLTDGGRKSGLQLAAIALLGGAAVLFLVAIILALEPTP